MSDLYTYDPRDSVFVWDDHEAVAFMEGTMVQVEHTNDLSTLHVGAKGFGTLVGSADKSGLFTLTLSQSSPTNDYLSAAVAEFYATDEIRIASALLRKLGTDERCEASLAWVIGPPTVVHANGIEGREWRIACLDLEMFIGGAVPQ